MSQIWPSSSSITDSRPAPTMAPGMAERSSSQASRSSVSTIAAAGSSAARRWRAGTGRRRSRRRHRRTCPRAGRRRRSCSDRRSRGRSKLVPAEQPRHEDEVPARGDGQELRQALDDPEDDGVARSGSVARPQREHALRSADSVTSPMTRVRPAAPPGSHSRSPPTATTSTSMLARVEAMVASRTGSASCAVPDHQALDADREVAAGRVGARVQAGDRLHEEPVADVGQRAAPGRGRPGARVRARLPTSGRGLVAAPHGAEPFDARPRAGRCRSCAGTGSTPRPR